jgi:hypothetical protein
VAVRLRDAHAEGRLTVEELDERTAAAYGAVTRGELAALIDDLPGTEPERVERPSRRKLPRMPGRAAFTVSWRGPPDPRRAGADVLELLVPAFFSYGYELVERTPDRLVLERRYQPGWTILLAIFLFPLGLLALLARGSEIVTIDLASRDGYTLAVAQGVAPRKIRRALAELEDDQARAR